MPCRPIEGLTIYEGYICTCIEVQCDYYTRRARKIYNYMPVHGRKASEHTNAIPLWRACKLQTYFTAKGLINYFLALRDLDKEAEIMQDVEASRADRVPWLVHTGFPTHLQGLRDTEIISSYALPRSGDDNGNGGGDNSDDDDGEEEGSAVDTDRQITRSQDDAAACKEAKQFPQR
ncbi:uncharacterized protein FRV6_14212 [Fusarium oxysporum]|uniref:Uncharacterized protein n=1 Tax=Fusarium oxysporum TaxID=5507 RepID=A0A2H3TN63_FUSOX|nr:uncharacterized protein FRV6_14212 [Fusarium oxysporum]